MTAQSPDSAQIRNVSIISLSRHRGQKTAEGLRDQICELADRTDVGAHQSAHNETHDTFSATFARCSLVEAVSLELEIGSRGNSLSSIFLSSLEGDHAIGERAKKVWHSEMTSLKVNLITCLDRQPSRNAAAAIRVTDSILMVLGVDEHTSPLLPSTVQLAVREACKPVVFLDRLDEILFRHSGDMELEDLYQAFKRTIHAVNAVIKHCRGRPSKVELELDPRQNTVLFGSTAAKWGFSLAEFAKLHPPELDVDAAELQKHLWGDFSFETSGKKWMPMVEESTEWGNRAFNQFILAPMFEIRSAVIAFPDNPKPLASLLSRLKVKLSAEDERKRGRELFNAIMQAYLPIGIALRSVIPEMPSPLDAQKYRTACLYSGPSGDEPTVGMVQCERVAPLLIYATHFIPAKSSKEKVYLLGRVFAGELASGADVHILGTGRHYGARPIDGIFAIAAGRTNIIRPVVQAAVGDLVLLTGLHEFMQGPGTICTSPRTPRFLDMYYTRPATKYSVKVTAPEMLPSLVAGMDFLCKTDLQFESESTFSGENFIFGIDMSHVEACLKILRSFAKDPLIIDGPLPIYRETVTAKSSQTALSKSPNRFNRFYASAEPLDEDLVSAIEAGVISPLQQYKSRAAMLHADYSWDEKTAQKIWSFGPDNTGPNLIVDATKAVQYLFEMRDSFVTGFQWAVAEGPLAGERLRGVRLNIEDVMMFSDAIHRGGGQIMSTARRVTFASMLLATPRLVEEQYLVQVQMPTQQASKIRDVISRLPGVSIDASSGSEHLISKIWNTAIVHAYMSLKARLNLEACVQQDPELFQDVSIEFVQAGWQAVGNGDPLDQTSEAGRLLIDIRKEKGLPTEIDINNYLDKL
ncbi:hypothetical protein NLG97_g16 [Lecanicillium saksenae]|uniref:Uncharacterized protein n=1 Tax=Lecanicillium saksenae TaxID=468837 RepID=A0ACC1R7X9_9HYPO|nr:hypothetical protein NLG97_g16 [Lecanicillium saksenae]